MDDMEGSGTEEDPYKIESSEQLQDVRQKLDACYKLVSDIDATNTNTREFTPIGHLTDPFTGTFYGNDHQIANLCIKQPNKENVGFFDSIGEEGEVRNVGLTNASVQGKYYVGGLVGWNDGVVKTSYVQGGDVSGDKVVGGLVASNHGKVESSYTLDVDVSGSQDVGGLVGCNNSNNGVVKTSYVQGGVVSGDKIFGGLIGSNYGEIELSYKLKVNVSGDKIVGGGLVGLGESCFAVSSSNKPNISEKSDLIISRKYHRIFYIVETSKLFARLNSELYSCENVSPIEIQSLVEDKTEVVKMTQKFMLSVVTTI